MLRDRVRSVLTVTAVTTALLAGGTATAYAQDGNNCDPGEFCLYEHSGYNSGERDTYGKRQWEESDQNYGNDYWWDYRVPDHHKNDILNDEASSVKNRSGCLVVLYENKSHTGDYTNYSPGEEDGNLDGAPVGNDEASSHQFNC